jgi:hypothetical protein
VKVLFCETHFYFLKVLRLRPFVLLNCGILLGVMLTGKLKYWEENLSQSHFDHHMSHMGWSEIKAGVRGERPATNSLNHGTPFGDEN